MLALSIRQPWAWLIIRPDVTELAARALLRVGGDMKDVENRTWPAYHKIRPYTEFLIHAAKQIDRDGIAWVRETFPTIQLPETYDIGGIVGAATYLDTVTACDSRWFFGPYGFRLTAQRPTRFVPLRGQLGFFHVDVPMAHF